MSVLVKTARATGCWLQGSGHRVLATGFWLELLGTGFWPQGSGYHTRFKYHHKIADDFWLQNRSYNRHDMPVHSAQCCYQP